MTELALFTVGLLLITALAKYNNSNKLFWTFLTCFMIGFASLILAGDVMKSKESKATVESVQPTQALVVTQGSLVYLIAEETLPASVKATSKPVSQAIIPTNISSTSSCASGVTRGLYLHALPNPPNWVEIVDDS